MSDDAKEEGQTGDAGSPDMLSGTVDRIEFEALRRSLPDAIANAVRAGLEVYRHDIHGEFRRFEAAAMDRIERVEERVKQADWLQRAKEDFGPAAEPYTAQHMLRTRAMTLREQANNLDMLAARLPQMEPEMDGALRTILFSGIQREPLY